MHGAEAISGFKLLIALFSDSGWGPCGPFKEILNETLKKVNALNPKNVGVVVVAYERTEAEF